MNIISRSFAGVDVGLRDADGYINATALARGYYAATGTRRDVADWLRLDRTKQTLAHLSSITGKPVIELYQVFRGSPETGGGTWLHPKLSVRFGIWLSDEFGYAVECWLDEWKAEQNSVTSQPTTQFLYLERFRLFTAYTHIPPGYFCIFEEILGMMSKLEYQGYYFPENACPDISIGRCWNIWLRLQGWDTDQFPYYDHHYPDHRGVQPAKIYPIDPLGAIFKPWLLTTYMQDKLPEYVRKLSGVEDQQLVRQIVSATAEQYQLSQG